MTSIIVCGSLGRLGSAICRLAEEYTDVAVAAGVDVMPSGGGLVYPLFTDISQCYFTADAAVCVYPPSTKAVFFKDLLDFCVCKKTPLVLCTTGLDNDILSSVQAASNKVAILMSGNMSLGVNLLANLINRAAKMLYDAGFDLEIVEKHHNKKLDAPSGTAIMLSETINQALGGNMHMQTDRCVQQSERERIEIGIHSVRGGSITGEHSIIFAGAGETIELTHRAETRDVFALGAVKAAQFVHGKPAGMYGMKDLLNA